MPHTVLIVDDSAPIRKLLRVCIEQDTTLSVCSEAENGAAAVEKVKDLKPDIVILDMQMPVMNGLEAARQIRLIAPDTLMLMVTMHSNEQLRKEAQAAGIYDVLPKFEGVTERLLASLRNLAGRRQNAAQAGSQ